MRALGADEVLLLDELNIEKELELHEKYEYAKKKKHCCNIVKS